MLDGAVLWQHKSRRPVPLPARLPSSSPPWFSSTLAFTDLPCCNCVLSSKEEIRSIPALELSVLEQVEFPGGLGPRQRFRLLPIPPVAGAQPVPHSPCSPHPHQLLLPEAESLICCKSNARTSFALTKIPLKEFLQAEFVMHVWEHVFFHSY